MTPGRIEEVTDQVTCTAASRLAPAHQAERLPHQFRGLPNGYHGSHQFLIDDFVTACTGEREAPLDARVAASYSVPGLLAHQSARSGGSVMEVPSYLGSTSRSSGALGAWETVDSQRGGQIEGKEDVHITAGEANIVIVGGGLVGLSCAWELARSGVDGIVVFDKYGLASGTTGGSAGVICPVDFGA